MAQSRDDGPVPPPPPPPPPNTSRMPPQLPTATINAMRMTYINLFNQILDYSVNVNCICKTTAPSPNSHMRHHNPTSSKRIKLSESQNKQNPFDGNNFLSDEEEDEEEQSNHRVEMEGACSNMNIYDLEYDSPVSVNTSRLKICDLSCFEKMRYVNCALKACLARQTDDEREHKVEFDKQWASFKFLSRNPSCCDYYGTTIFHYAATEPNANLLKYCLEKYPDGVRCVDSKGMTPLMRAVQRNNVQCVKYLLDHTESDINGSSQSTYTPLWFAVTNGYNELASILLNYGASPSIIDKGYYFIYEFINLLYYIFFRNIR